MAAQDSIGFFVGQQLHQAIGIISGQCPAAGDKRERYRTCKALPRPLAAAQSYPLPLLQGGYRSRRDTIVIHLRWLSGNALRDHDTFFRALMRQHGPAHHITYRINMRRFGFTKLVNEDETSLIQRQTAVGENSSSERGRRPTATINLSKVSLCSPSAESEGHYTYRP